MISLFRPTVLAACVAALSAQPVFAEPLAQTLSARQKWTMSAPLNQPKPDCVETWSFAADGTMSVESGDERVQIRWRLGEDESAQAIYLRNMASTGGRDCLGIDNKSYDEPEPDNSPPIWLLLFREKDEILLCNPGFVVDKKRKVKIPMYGDNCWGKLKPSQ